MDKKKINVNIDFGEHVFFTDNVTVVHNPSKFVLDFTQSVPRFDSIGSQQQQSVAIKHRTILMDPVLAKMFLDVLKDNVKKYEKQHGKINVAKKKKSKKKSIVKDSAETSSRYIG